MSGETFLVSDQIKSYMGRKRQVKQKPQTGEGRRYANLSIEGNHQSEFFLEIEEKTEKARSPLK